MFPAGIRALLVGGGSLLGATVAGQTLSERDEDWLETQVGAIITMEERALFREIQEDDRRLFKDLFWMRRDSSPITPENEFRMDFAARVIAADKNFKGRGERGSETDMGRIFLLLGVPERRQGMTQPPPIDPPNDTALSLGEDRASSREELGQNDAETITWVYAPNPDRGIPDGLTILFRPRAGFGIRLVSSQELTQQLERVKERLVANPAVTYARDENGRLLEPDARFDPMSPAKLALKALREAGQTSDAIAFRVTPAFFRASPGQIYVPLDFVVSSGLSSSEAMVFGAVEDDDGVIIRHFEEKAAIQGNSMEELVWEMPLQLEPGSYKLYAGVMDDAARLQGTKVVDLEVPRLEGRDLMLSSILMFAEATQIGEAQGSAGRAFLLGGYHFVPKRELVYHESEQLSGVFYAYNYGVEGDSPNLTVQLSFFKDGEPRGATRDQPFELQTKEMALTIFDVPLNAPSFQDAGSYELEIRVTDHVKGAQLTKEIPFRIEEK